MQKRVKRLLRSYRLFQSFDLLLMHWFCFSHWNAGSWASKWQHLPQSQGNIGRRTLETPPHFFLSFREYHSVFYLLLWEFSGSREWAGAARSYRVDRSRIRCSSNLWFTELLPCQQHVGGSIPLLSPSRSDSPPSWLRNEGQFCCKEHDMSMSGLWGL